MKYNFSYCAKLARGTLRLPYPSVGIIVMKTELYKHHVVILPRFIVTPVTVAAAHPRPTGGELFVDY
jgi:hypothetical protein